MQGSKPVALMDPAPRTVELIFTPEDYRELAAIVDIRPKGDAKPTAAEIDSILQEATFVIGQTDLPRERLEGAPRLKAVFNVEGNFLPNIDYPVCFARGIHILSTSPVFAQSVAEIGLAFALDLARGVTHAHMGFRDRVEQYGMQSNEGAFLLRRQRVGIVGFGALGRALRALLVPFGCEVGVYDPWLPDRLVRSHDCEPESLEDLLARSRIVFLTASVTSENAQFIGREQIAVMAEDSVLILLSRAGIVDFDAMVEAAAHGHIRAATDVFPEEPLGRDHRARSVPNLLLSGHRAGALTENFKEMGSLVLADVKQILRDLPPRSCQRAEQETVGRMRSKPVGIN